MEIAYFFTYEITNISRREKGLNPFKYLGQHCTFNLEDLYKSSCKPLREDIKNGDKYELSPLNFYKNIFDLGYAEHTLIKERNAIKDKNYYNTTNPLYFNYFFGKKHKLSSLKLMSKNNCMHRPEIIEKIVLKTTGKKRTKEQCERINNSHKGQKAWSKGLTKDTDERVKKISENLKGKIKSEEHIKNISIALKGKPSKFKGQKTGQISWCKGLTKDTDERVKKISEKLKGRIVSEYTKIKQRKPCKEETKLKIGIANKGKLLGTKWSEERKQNYIPPIVSRETRNKISKALKGRIFSDDHIAKLSKAKKGKPSWNKGKPAKKIQCPFCKRFIDNMNFKKWHGEKCKLKSK